MTTPIARLVRDQQAVVFGWFKSVRPAAKGKLLFADVSDGSNASPLAVVIAAERPLTRGLLPRSTTSAPGLSLQAGW